MTDELREQKRRLDEAHSKATPGEYTPTCSCMGYASIAIESVGLLTEKMPEWVAEFFALAHNAWPAISAALDRAVVYDEAEISVQAIGSEAAHIIELLKAEAEGRVAIYPCKEGDTVYRLKSMQSFDCNCEECEHMEDGFPCRDCEHHSETIRWGVQEGKYSGYCDYMAFGKTVFLTRAQAEAAMEKGEKA